MICKHFVKVLPGLALLPLLAGCAAPDLRLVSKPAMQFSEWRAYAAASRVTAQFEPGRMATGGAQAAVCAYCR